MRKIVIIYIFFSLLSCQKEIHYTCIKNNLLYSDKKNNIYLKVKIDVLSEKYPQSNKIVYLDIVSYQYKILKLKQFVDVASFHEIENRDNKDIFVKGIYEDKKYIYIFRDHPSSFSNIKIIDKKL